MANKLPPDVISLAPLVPGLRLPIAIVTKAQATVRVDDRRSRQSGRYNFNGWGLEVALPAGRHASICARSCTRRWSCW